MLMMQLSKFLQKDATRSDITKDEESRDDSQHNHVVSLKSSNRSEDDDDSDPSARKGNTRHEKDDDRSLLWRDFDGSSNSSPYSVSNENTKANPNDTIDSEEESTSSCPFDEITNVDIDLIPGLGPSDTDTTPIRSNISRNPSVSVSLEEGWKGIMVASFGAPAIPSGTSTATSRSYDDAESRKSGTSDCFPISIASAAGRSFPSVDARVPILSDDEEHSEEDINNRNSKTAPYAALFLDSMLGSDVENEKNNTDGKEEDSLLWTWIGGDNKENPNETADPPTEEIVFQVGSWEDSTKSDADNNVKSSDDDDNDDKSGVSESPFDENENENENENDSDLPSLSLLAASTYSRVFGIDYLEGCHDSGSNNTDDDEERSGEEEYIDWSVQGGPMRSTSTIPYGTTEVTSDTTQSDDNSNTGPESTTGASSGSGLDDSDNDNDNDNDNNSDWKCLERWLWITFCMGIVLVFALIVVVFSHGVQNG